MFTKTRRAPFAVSCKDDPRRSARNRGQTGVSTRRKSGALGHSGRSPGLLGAKAAPWDTLVGPRGFLLSSAHKLNDLELRTRAQNRLPPARPLDDPSVQFHRHARRVQFQLPDETQDRLPLSGGLRLSVDRDLHHLWLTPSFSNHYSQI